jgi:uncharacterized protein YxeA
MEDKKDKNNIGTSIGIIIVIFMLIIGAFYFYKQITERQKEIEKINEQNKAALEEIIIFEKDLESIKIDNLGEGIDEL